MRKHWAYQIRGKNKKNSWCFLGQIVILQDEEVKPPSTFIMSTIPLTVLSINLYE